LCEESKECKETDRQIPEEGCCHRVKAGKKISFRDQLSIGGGGPGGDSIVLPNNRR
jgi:hypothetical protein